MRASSKYYPLRLGRTQKNAIWKAEGRIAMGRWVNLNSEDFDKDPEWVKVGATGTLIDRALGRIPNAIRSQDLAVFTHYPNPKLEMMCFELLPINSRLFDMSEEPNVVLPTHEDVVSPLTISNPVTMGPSPVVSRSLNLALGASLLFYTIFLSGTVGAEKRNP